MISEIDNLKDAWKTISDAGSQKEYSADELKKIVKKQSNNELAKIRRKILFEWTIAFILSVFLVVFISSVKPADTLYALFFIVVIFGFSFIPYINVIKFKFTPDTTLKNYLEEFISRFDNLVKKYIRMVVFLYPVAGLGGFLLGLHSKLPKEEWNSFFTTESIIWIIVAIVAISLLGCWMQKKYFNWLYGKNIDRLRDCLKNLEK
jgi:hypothetical protein